MKTKPWFFKLEYQRPGCPLPGLHPGNHPTRQGDCLNPCWVGAILKWGDISPLCDFPATQAANQSGNVHIINPRKPVNQEMERQPLMEMFQFNRTKVVSASGRPLLLRDYVAGLIQGTYARLF